MDVREKMPSGKRLIDANAFLKDILTDGIGKTIIEYSESGIAYMIRKRPTIDAVPVVRCRECKFRSSWMMNRNLRYICPESGLFPNGENDFCSYGERKEGADNG